MSFFNIPQTISAIKFDLEQKLSIMTSSAGIANFSKYEIGFPDNQNEAALFVRYTGHISDDDTNSKSEPERLFNFDLDLQLPAISELESYKYMNCVTEYLEDFFDPTVYEFMYFFYTVKTAEKQGDNPKAIFTVTMGIPMDDYDDIDDYADDYDDEDIDDDIDDYEFR